MILPPPGSVYRSEGKPLQFILGLSVRCTHVTTTFFYWDPPPALTSPREVSKFLRSSQPVEASGREPLCCAFTCRASEQRFLTARPLPARLVCVPTSTAFQSGTHTKTRGSKCFGLMRRLPSTTSLKGKRHGRRRQDNTQRRRRSAWPMLCAPLVAPLATPLAWLPLALLRLQHVMVALCLLHMASSAGLPLEWVPSTMRREARRDPPPILACSMVQLVLCARATQQWSSQALTVCWGIELAV